MAEILPVHPGNPGEEPLRRAGEILLRGEVAAVPTDTVYGLCARALDAEAVDRLYRAKGRTEEKGAPVLIGHPGQLALLAEPLPSRVRALMDALWPGPLTFILHARPGLPSRLTGGGKGGVAVRLPAQNLCRALALIAGPFAATSANWPGEPPLRDASAVAVRFGPRIALILDGGHAGDAPASTVADLRGERPAIIRKGGVHFDAVLRAWERVERRGATPAAG
ncbi:MAG: threonylcarbamoyl-AMP synthase [Candidatus Tectomicrobia bacterium]|nr:threonylcarbamoyl-AMP synthase [Candidatus Tectomicrobia bacterium]MBI2176911.1 threonylcarbamoyl-AMP synthase [Candidatus Tectomicrobia bacterium]